MNSNPDYQGTYKLKFILPFIFFSQLIISTVSQVFHSQMYSYYLFGIIVYLNTRLLSAGLKMIYVFFQIKKYMKSNYIPVTFQQNYYLFIIPNYNQGIELLTYTLQTLNKHSMSKHKYIICLAMQNHELGSQQKAQELKQKFKNSFKNIFHTIHILQPNQVKGKASNVNWAVTHMYQYLQQLQIFPQNIILNIIDADAQVPYQYCQHIEQFLCKYPEQKHITFFVSPIIFCRNNKEVPFMVRGYDSMNSLFQAQQLNDIGDISFPISNYSLSYKLAQKIQFWDVCADAIGQDYHTYMKSFWKTNTQLKLKIIYTPLNMMNIIDNNYCGNIRAKFWQSQRHFQGVADFGYTIMMFYRSKKTLKGCFLFYLMMQIWLLPTILYAMMIGEYFSWLYFLFNHKEKQTFIGFLVFSIISPCIVFFLFLVYQCIRRMSFINYFNGKDKIETKFGSFYLVLQSFISMIINMYTLACYAFIHALLTSPFKQKQYIVSKKFSKQIK